MFDQQTEAEIAGLAKELGVEAAALLAVAEVESAGKAVDWNNWPLIRWEGHYFYRLLDKPATTDKLKQAVDAGLASKKGGGVPNPKSQQDRYALLARAQAIDDNAALSSCSWGLGQVMGSHWQSLGFESVQDLVARCKESVAGQVDVMARFIKVNKLADKLKNHRWTDFALAYNGPSGPAAGYDKKIEAAYNKHKSAH